MARKYMISLPLLPKSPKKKFGYAIFCIYKKMKKKCKKCMYNIKYIYIYFYFLNSWITWNYYCILKYKVFAIWFYFIYYLSGKVIYEWLR